MLGWKANYWVHASGVLRLPLLGPIWFASKRLIARWLASGMGVLIEVGGESTRVHPFTIVYSIGEWEPYTEELFQDAINPGSTVLDIGAHHGYFSILAARRAGSEGKVYAIEPAPENFQILKKNIELNHLKNVVLVNKAVGDSNTNASFFIAKPNDVQGSLFPTLRPNEYSIPVECITIDDLLVGEAVDVVKMDIEGAEPFALKGMINTLEKSPNIVLFLEFHGPWLKRAGVEPQEFLDQLKGNGFECQLINDGRKRLQPLKLELTPEEGFYHGFCNILCVKKATTE